MNMKKLLATGLIASVAMASAEASNNCGNGGLYIQGSFGVSMTKMKYKNNLEPQYNVLIAEEFANMGCLVFVDNNLNLLAQGYAHRDINTVPQARTDVAKNTLSKSKGVFQCEFGVGWDYRLGSAMFGITVSFGKNCGNVKKKEKGLQLGKYLSGSVLPTAVATLNNAALNLTGFRGNIRGQFPYVDNAAAYAQGQNPAFVPLALLENQKFYERDLELEFKCKNKYYISIMPKFGVLVNPSLELYVTAGVKIKSDQYTIYAPSLKKSSKKTVTKCIPAVGLGLQYNFQNGMFTNLSYTFNFKAKKTFKLKANNALNLDATVKHTLQNSSHDIKLGFGYRF